MKQSLINEITDVLQKLPIVTNLARKKFVSHFVVGLIKSRNVQFCEIAQHLNDKAKIASNENRIQDFFRDVTIDYYAVAVLLISLLPKNRKLRLCIDRTEWDFGNCQVNILMVLVGCDDIQIPLYWELLDNKSGNSNAEDRINLLDLCLNLIGKERVGLIVGDREFVGSKWFRYRKDNKLPFVTGLSYKKSACQFHPFEPNNRDEIAELGGIHGNTGLSSRIDSHLLKVTITTFSLLKRLVNFL